MKYTFAEEDLRSLLDDLSIEIGGETSTDFICFCPFHSNRDTPAFNLSKESANHPWRCWNAACGKAGVLTTLLEELRGYSHLQAMRYLSQFKPTRVMRPSIPRSKDLQTIPEDSLNSFLPPDQEVLRYMTLRGFSQETLKYFQVGTEERAIVIPCRGEDGQLLGFTKRMTYRSKHKYFDKGLPKRNTLFNIQNAKDSSTVIITEGPLDAMKVHQAGYKNVVATMMGDLTDAQADILRRNFKAVIIFTDLDESGRKIGGIITEKLKGLDIYWANIPEGYKDAGEMNEAQIIEAIEDKLSTLQMNLKNRRKLTT